MESDYKDPKFINVPNMLKAKVGQGGISPSILKKSQDFIENNPVDFTPYAQEYIKLLNESIKKLKENPDMGKNEEFIRQCSVPMMSLKANGGMFKYPLISMVADVGLNFMSRIDEINEDGAEILKAHCGAVSLIIANNLKGYAGPEGKAITEELRDACIRYFNKYK